MNMQFIGTPKQIKWCETIYNDLCVAYEQKYLPRVLSASWWIEHRNDTLAELLNASKHVRLETPFTTTYPRYTKEHAVSTLQLIHGLQMIIFDCETTGLGKGHEIIEISFVTLTGKILFSSRIKPTKATMTKDAYKVHGIPMDDLADYPTFDVAWKDIEPLLEGGILLSYNGQFDIGMLRRSLDACGLVAPSMDAICILKLTQAYFNLEDPLKLSEACERLDIDASQFGESHGALADALTASSVLRTLLLNENLMSPCDNEIDTPCDLEMINLYGDCILASDTNNSQSTIY
jgi:DNA polymerase III, epsilon subunit and related 3''-5'' exonucleases